MRQTRFVLFSCGFLFLTNAIPPSLSFSFTSALGVGYMMVCTANYPNVLAFCFLDELQKEFIVTYESKRIGSAVRPYSFIEFGESARKGRRGVRNALTPPVLNGWRLGTCVFSLS